jgi:hypothetical protein
MKKRNFFMELLKDASAGRAENINSSPLNIAGMNQAEEVGMQHLFGGNKHTFALPTKNNRAVLDTSSGFIGTDVIMDLLSLSNYLVLLKAGMRFYENLLPNISYPYPSLPSVGAKAENDAADDAALSFGSLSFTSKRIPGYVDISKQLIMQGGPDVERYVIQLIIAALASKFESYVLGKAAGSAIQPQGLFYRNTTGTDTKVNAVVPTRAAILAMEKTVDDNNALTGSPAFITSGSGARLLKTTPRESGHDRFLLEDGKMSDYPVFFSNNVPNDAGADGLGSGLVFGNFQDLIAVQFGGYNVTVDPFLLAISGKTRITINAFFDCKGGRGTQSTGAGTDADDYATSFARIAIKAAS